MNITVTLILQIIAFLIMIWLVRRYMWGPLAAVLEARQKTIAEGLASGQAGEEKLQQAEQEARALLDGAKREAQGVIAHARGEAKRIEEVAQQNASAMADKELAKVRATATQEMAEARDALRKEYGAMVFAGVARVLGEEVDIKKHEAMLADVSARW